MIVRVLTPNSFAPLLSEGVLLAPRSSAEPGRGFPAATAARNRRRAVSAFAGQFLICVVLLIAHLINSFLTTFVGCPESLDEGSSAYVFSSRDDA